MANGRVMALLHMTASLLEDRGIGIDKLPPHADSFPA